MFVAHILFGIIAGIVAAATVLLAGMSIWLAFLAYVAGGLLGVGIAVVWSLMPTRIRQAKDTGFHEAHRSE